ncbi:histidine phosphatase superfamily [Multifurca ochricompacta]|uniref:Histidine phosphatase superfamily n=1 Tax=Multifurca ochricompacta TaxID=376703 RepID=A0AAD4MFG5_9AGAM|nr:histidine phosphatase superfamily [Multifurca ochricompacta]
MTLETIYILRHGFRLNWVTMTWKSATGLPRDPPLAAFGEVQAKEVAAYFMSLPEDQRPTAIFSSPYYRCLQTSRPTSIALDLPIYAEHGLSEWYSPVEPGTGLHPRPSSASTLKTHFPEIDDSWSSVWYPSRKGEDVEGVHDRLAGFLTVFVPEVQRRFAGVHKRILLVSHAATVIALTRELVGNRSLSFRAACCSLTTLDRKVGGSAQRTVAGDWTVRVLGDGSHLKDGPQRDWGFEDIEIADGEVVNDHGVPGTENEKDEPVGSQILELTSRM